jgi:large subunit ribosomal protein L4
MAKLQVLRWDNTTSGDFELDDKVSNTPYRPYIIKDAVVQFRASLRQGTHSTKTRGEVSGSTKKPWKQKGTGRARAGSIKSPVWRQGGVVFGTKPQNNYTGINKKVKKSALQSALAEKIRTNQVLILEDIQFGTHKTKDLKKGLDVLGCSSALIVVDQVSKNLELASRNLKAVHVLSYRSLNVYELLRFQTVIFEKAAISAIEQRLLS